MKRFVIFSIFTLFALNLWAQQPEIISVLPNQGFQGSQMNIVLRGTNTHFIQRSSVVQFGNSAKIKINNINVQDQRTITASINIDAACPENDYDIIVSTGNEVVKYPAAFSVIKVGATISATLNVLPVQTISLADFDVNNIKKAPLLFIVSVFNCASYTKGITAKLTVSGSRYGIIGTGIRKISGGDLISNLYRFSNRDFDKIDVSNASQSFINAALTTNVIPPDDYKYEISLFDNNGKPILGSDGNPIVLDGTNSISNPTSGLQLISPGAPLNGDPETIASRFPQFQWFSQASNFDIAVYKVNKAQSTASDIASQMPISSQKGISTNLFVYPNSARPLEEGVTYAWQITAHIVTSRGDQAIPSEMYWFSVGRPNPDYSNIVRIEVLPNDIEMNAGDTITLSAISFNTKDEKVSVKPEWRVTPPEAGYVSQSGKFTAGNSPTTCAVVAKYGNVQEYATIKINPSGSLGWDFGGFVQKVFGLPKGK